MLLYSINACNFMHDASKFKEKVINLHRGRVSLPFLFEEPCFLTVKRLIDDEYMTSLKRMKYEVLRDVRHVKTMQIIAKMHKS